MTQDDNKNTSKPEILLVDDDGVTRSTFAELIEDDFVVHTAAGVDEAMGILRKNPDIKAVMTDFNMPLKSGLRLLTEMHAEGMYQPTVLCTARDMEEVRDMSTVDEVALMDIKQEEGRFGYLRKGRLRTDEVIAALNKLIDACSPDDKVQGDYTGPGGQEQYREQR